MLTPLGWRPVFLDDRAPASNRYDNALLGAAMSNTKVISLLVKTFGKLYGNIEPIVGGTAADALAYFLGAIPRPDKKWGSPEELKESLLYKGSTTGVEDTKWWEKGFYLKHTDWAETWGHEVSFNGAELQKLAKLPGGNYAVTK